MEIDESRILDHKRRQSSDVDFDEKDASFKMKKKAQMTSIKRKNGD